MAGLAVFATILIYALVALVGASILSVKLYRVAKKRVSEGLNGRKAMAFGAAAPFLGVLWLLIAFLVHVQISNRLAHQDCGLSGDPYVTLPNGYVVGSLNTYSGYFKAPGYETDVPIAGPGYVRSLVDLKFSDPYFTGTQFDSHSLRIRRFVFNTRTLEFHAGNRTVQPKAKMRGAMLKRTHMTTLIPIGEFMTSIVISGPNTCLSGCS